MTSEINDVVVNRKIHISRDIHTHDEVEEKYPKSSTVRTMSEKVKSHLTCTKRDMWKSLTTVFPIIRFIKHYNIKNDLLNDMLAGLTVSFLQLPQGIGFGILASLKPIYGIYSTFFPVLFYMFFGTSPHVSLGTNAVMALLTQNVVEREEQIYIDSFKTGTMPHPTSGNFTTENPMLNATSAASFYMPSEKELLDVKVGAAMASSLLVGMILTGMGLLRLGFLTMYFSVSFVGGFTTAAAVHIASSQAPNIFGIKVSAQAGAGRLVKMYIELFTHISETIPAEVIISVTYTIILLLVKICINERFKSKLRIPIPIDLLIVVVGTVISHFAHFKENFEVSVVGTIPSGIPSPKVPSLTNASGFAKDCFVMAILSFAITISMAKITAKIHGTVVDDNQELLAYGISNIGSSFFFSFPTATGPPRSMVLSSLGTKTTLNAIPTTVFMLLVLLWIGQLFVSLPVSIVAAMIVVAMKDLLLQVRDIPKLWKICKADCITWIVTCLVSILVDLDYGIIVGVGMSMLLVIVQHQMASGQLLGVTKDGAMLVTLKGRDGIEHIPGISVFSFAAPLYYANAERFKNQIYSKIVDPLRYKKDQANLEKAKRKYGKVNEYQMDNSSVFTVDGKENGSVSEMNLTTKHENDVVIYYNGMVIGGNNVRHVIIDCQTMNNIDLGGINILKQVTKEYSSIDINLYLARCPVNMLSSLEEAEFFKTFSRKRVFFDIIDAIKGIQSAHGTKL